TRIKTAHIPGSAMPYRGLYADIILSGIALPFFIFSPLPPPTWQQGRLCFLGLSYRGSHFESGRTIDKRVCMGCLT
ncbi:hypothetical protein, partial [Paramuribaculum intestinale]|uniref:hypothetical protein n=1 Tax=Paramuribaculum intestinale TaxID=2094151 RepID=UPI0025A60B59